LILEEKKLFDNTWKKITAFQIKIYIHYIHELLLEKK